MVLAASLSAALSTGCNRNSDETFSGHYSGTDGSNTSPAKLELTLAVVGGGYMTGIWKQESGNVEGHISGNFGYLNNPAQLRISKGHCLGTFQGEFTTETTSSSSQLTGHFFGNPNCLDQVYHIKVTKLEPPKYR